MPKLQCMSCFEWYDEEQIAYSHWLPEENHLETECKQCVEGTHIGFSFLPSNEYWEMRDNDKKVLQMRCDVCMESYLYKPTQDELDYGIHAGYMTCDCCTKAGSSHE